MPDCCVDGCTSSVTFYRFPKNPVLRKIWLKALGCPKWKPPADAHVCSKHFSPKQQNTCSDVGDSKGYPDLNLPYKPYNSIFNVKVCRFCLATDVKMFSLQTGILRNCLVNILGLQKNHEMIGLPQYLCYICTGYLLKMSSVIEKSMITQATLLEIYSANREVPKSVYKLDRKKLNLVHNLQSHNATPTKIFKYVYDENLKKSVSVKIESNREHHISDLNIEDAEVERSNKGSSENMCDFDFESHVTEKNIHALCERLKHEIDESEVLLRDLCDKTLDTHDICKTRNETKKKESKEVLLVHKQKQNRTDMRLSSNVPSRTDLIGAIACLQDHNYAFKVSKMPPIEVNYECPICDDVFKTSAGLSQHISKHHQDEGAQFTKFVNKLAREAMDVDSDVGTIKNEKLDDSETDTCSEGEHYNTYEAKSPLIKRVRRKKWKLSI